MRKFRKRRLSERRAALDNRVALRRVKINRQNGKIGFFFRFFFGDDGSYWKAERLEKIGDLARASGRAPDRFDPPFETRR